MSYKQMITQSQSPRNQMEHPSRETLISAMEKVDGVTHAFVIMAHADGEVSITWSSMTEWQAKRLVQAGFERIEERV